MDWERARWLWDRQRRGLIESGIQASALVLESISWPLIAADYGGGVLVCSETDDSPYAKLLDRDAGIDAIVWRDSPRSLRGLAHRAQDCTKSYNTFTIRSNLATTNNDTEIDKRLRSIEEHTLGPNLTLQTYVDLKRERLLAVGVTNTDDLMRLVAQHRMPDKRWPSQRVGRPVYTKTNGADGNEFVAVEWWALASAGQLNVYPIADKQLTLI